MRVLVPEILDHLAADDPRATRSRRDLARINWVMRQSAIMATALSGFPAPRTIVDLGGGDGRFLLSVARRLVNRWPRVTCLVADQQDIVGAQTRAGFVALGWSCEVARGDIFQTLPHLSPDIVTANLFLHHFDDVMLARLLALVAQRARGFAACEPRRSGFALLASHLVFALGANDVTRHDAVASVRAGFRAKELSKLWPQDRGWRLDEHGSFPFTHVLKAHAV
ncbi:MAG: methyltransferase [Alphaproteobacteria bacterium]